MTKKALIGKAAAAPRRRRLSPEDRRREILHAATIFFSEEGFNGGTRELAQKIGVTQPLLYRYFPSKEHLIKEVYRTVYLERWDPAWDRLLTDRTQPISKRFEEFYQAYTDVIFTREWMRIYLFSGLKGLDINRWYLDVVQKKILTRIIQEYRHEAGLPPQKKASAIELELAWAFHSGIFYYGMRKLIYEAPVLEDKNRVISVTLSVFLIGIGRLFGTETGGAASDKPLVSPAVSKARKKMVRP
ncbi:TetR/AcrR family transcriptional regulator [Tardiphaga sp.]|uniref:TetR/AcrR family transcriptional regulator n=1 Tax=Tardiphaga sp. TaxID=1926292 RepID=UPI0026363EA3|nr:TetR/AcrR family transcriptional regulator [Tardiphaga sp.]MDB5616519.1 TetR/AcrR family transcriptional regulator [Tardiphaga sp.]